MAAVDVTGKYVMGLNYVVTLDQESKDILRSLGDKIDGLIHFVDESTKFLRGENVEAVEPAKEVKPIHVVSRENVVKYHVERYYDGQIKAVELFKELLAARQLYDLSWSDIDGAILETEEALDVDTGSIVYSFIAYSQGH